MAIVVAFIVVSFLFIVYILNIVKFLELINPESSKIFIAVFHNYKLSIALTLSFCLARRCPRWPPPQLRGQLGHGVAHALGYGHAGVPVAPVYLLIRILTSLLLVVMMSARKKNFRVKKNCSPSLTEFLTWNTVGL